MPRNYLGHCTIPVSLSVGRSLGKREAFASLPKSRDTRTVVESSVVYFAIDVFVVVVIVFIAVVVVAQRSLLSCVSFLVP